METSGITPNSTVRRFDEICMMTYDIKCVLRSNLIRQNVTVGAGDVDSHYSQGVYEVT